MLKVGDIETGYYMIQAVKTKVEISLHVQVSFNFLVWDHYLYHSRVKIMAIP